MFRSERGLVDTFCRSVRTGASPWPILGYRREFEFDRGRPDFIAVVEGKPDSFVLSVEAKLREWRRALDQAYRNTCFAHVSFVLLPPTVLDAARRSEYEFSRRGVGLCTIRNNQVVVAIAARIQEPVQLWLSQQARKEARYRC